MILPRDLIVLALLGAALILLTLVPDIVRPLLTPLSGGAPPIYDRDSLFNLTLWHLATASLALLAALALALLLGILVTRPSGAEFLPLARTLANLGQAIPPVTILAVAVPMVGFGFEPTFIALLAYGLLPIFENTVSGIRLVSADVVEAARGTGMSPLRILGEVELPLAAPVILAGIRISAAFSIGTATLGSTVGAKGLGEVIIAGLQANNLAYVVQGGVVVALLAILVDQALGAIGKRLPAMVAQESR